MRSDGLLGWHEHDLVEGGQLSGRDTVGNACLRTGTRLPRAEPPRVPRPVPSCDPPLPPPTLGVWRGQVVPNRQAIVRPREERADEQLGVAWLAAMTLVLLALIAGIVLCAVLLGIVQRIVR